MLTKNQTKIMQVFTSHITEQYSMREIAKILQKDSSQTRRAIKPLIEKQFLTVTQKKHLILNYQKNHQQLAYIEHLRSKEFLNKPKNKELTMFTKEVKEKFPEDFFIFLLFGSTITAKKPRDIDILFITDDIEKVNTTEKILYNISRNYEQKIDINVISPESVYEMLAKREELNIMNELLNKHLIIYGAETFYRLIKKGRT